MEIYVRLLYLPLTIMSAKLYIYCVHAVGCVCVCCPVVTTQAAASALVQGQVPHSWDAMWEGPAAASDYLRSAVRRQVPGLALMLTCRLVVVVCRAGRCRLPPPCTTLAANNNQPAPAHLSSCCFSYMMSSMNLTELCLDQTHCSTGI